MARIDAPVIVRSLAPLGGADPSMRAQVAIAEDSVAGSLEPGSGQTPATEGAYSVDAGQGGLIARIRELAHLDHVLWRARRGTANAVALRGEPGVGKSALIEAAVARANDFAVVQLRGTAIADRAGIGRELPRSLADLLAGDGSPAGEAAVVGALEGVLRSSAAPVLVAVDDCHLLPRWFSDALVDAVTGSMAGSPIALVLAGTTRCC
jgi:hypothetical protein